MYRGASPPSDSNTFWDSLETPGEGPIYIKVIDKGQIIAYRQTNIEKLHI